MGSGIWDASAYNKRNASAAASGKTFSYSNTARATGDYKVNPLLDPKTENKAGPLAGTNIRECRDNADHPNSVPVSVFFDSTGSMADTPRVVQKKLETSSV